MTLAAGGLPLQAAYRAGKGKPPETLHIYIEGDGAAWLSPHHPPPDPTPATPTAFAMAAADPAPAVAYLARPCQFLDRERLRNCPPRWWTSDRFSDEVVAAYRSHIDTLARQSGARRLRIIGYSGGGVIALRVAQGRDDVEAVVTVASPLSLAGWTVWHGVSSLSGAEPEPGGIAHTRHYFGENDAVVPPALTEKLAADIRARIRIVPGFDHDCCWADAWPRLLEEMR